jgi:hypothetical protein
MKTFWKFYHFEFFFENFEFRNYMEILKFYENVLNF